MFIDKTKEKKPEFIVTPTSKDYLKSHIYPILRGNTSNTPLPGFNVPAQIVLHMERENGRILILRAILGDYEIDFPLEFDVLSIKDGYNPKTYLHPSTIFFTEIFNS